MNTAPAQGRPRPDWPWHQVRRHWAAWWERRHRPCARLELKQHNLYILPSRSGWMMALTLLILLIASINYQLNLGYLLTFLLAGSMATGTWTCHRNLVGLMLEIQPGPAVFAGQAASARLIIDNQARRNRYALAIVPAGNPDSEAVWVDCAARQHTTAVLHVPALHRGWMDLPLLKLQTHYPLGIFRVWSLWRPAARVLVYPSPEVKPPPLPEGETGNRQPVQRSTARGGEIDGVRPYHRGDPMKWIVWKKTDPLGGLVSREHMGPSNAARWLDWRHARAGSTEADLSRMTAWVLAAERSGLIYGLRLPGREIPPSCGHEHQRLCLEALALC